MTRCMVGEVVSVICDDTDVFALLLHVVAEMKPNGQLCMCSTVKDRAVIDIMQSVVHTSIEPDRFAFHALTGADTSAATFGIGKIKALKVARTARLPLHAIGDTQADEAIVLEQATSFILSCYGKGLCWCASMSEARIKMWRKKTDIGAALKLWSLPPTTEAFTENAGCTLEGINWRHSAPDARRILLEDHDWARGNPVPVAVLEMMRYGCAFGCKGGRCKCSTIGCSVFCTCKGGEVCMNMLTKKSQE